MTDIVDTFIRSLDAGQVWQHPYRHWTITDALPAGVAAGVGALPLTAPATVDNQGQRATLNDSRCFFAPDTQDIHPVCRDMASAFQDPRLIAHINRMCGIDLTGTSLRIEYCLDADGFWLEPHTDLGVKKFTLLLYLSQGEGAEGWGTDIFDDDHNVVETAPCLYNSALIFVPGTNTWHGFRKRPIRGVRRTVIINYVGPEWRSRHELCFPDTTVTALAA